MTTSDPSRARSPRWTRQLLSRAREHPLRSFVVLLLVALGLWLAAGRIFPSEKGRIRAALQQLRDGVVKGDPDRALSHISPYFNEEGVDRDRLARWLRSTLPQRPVDRAFLIVRRIAVRAGIAHVTLSVRSWHGGRFVRSEWQVVLEKINDRWLVRRATPTDVDDRPAIGFRQVLRLY